MPASVPERLEDGARTHRQYPRAVAGTGGTLKCPTRRPVVTSGCRSYFVRRRGAVSFAMRSMRLKWRSQNPVARARLKRDPKIPLGEDLRPAVNVIRQNWGETTSCIIAVGACVETTDKSRWDNRVNAAATRQTLRKDNQAPVWSQTGILQPCVRWLQLRGRRCQVCSLDEDDS